MVLIDEFHPEDIKAAIRKRYRSLGRFELAEKLGKNSVADVLRGRPSARTEAAIRRVMAEDAKWGVPKAIIADPSSEDGASHRLSDKAA